jgi:hypothetical protein
LALLAARGDAARPLTCASVLACSLPRYRLPVTPRKALRSGYHARAMIRVRGAHY